MSVKARSQRDLLSQLKSLVAASGNEKKFLLAHDALNVDKVGRTTVYDALHGRKIGVKLEGLLSKIKEQHESESENAAPKFVAKKRSGNRPVIVDDSVGVAEGSKYQLSRPVTSYVKQLQSLIAASGSERKFFTDYAKFNVAGAVRSSVYTAVHDGKVRPALAQMLDAILEWDNQPLSRKAKAVMGHGVEVLPKDDLEEVENV